MYKNVPLKLDGHMLHEMWRALNTTSGGFDHAMCRYVWDRVLAAHPPSVEVVAPIPMLLWCPECGDRHIDAGEFATKPHHTHACQSCGFVWRPAVVDTVGVEFLPGFKDKIANDEIVNDALSRIEREFEAEEARRNARGMLRAASKWVDVEAAPARVGRDFISGKHDRPGLCQCGACGVIHIHGPASERRSGKERRVLNADTFDSRNQGRRHYINRRKAAT